MKVPSTFPIERRPIYYHAAANMAYKNRDVAYPMMAETIQRVLDKHPDDRILVHTVSYDLNGFLAKELDGPRIHTYGESAAKSRAVDSYRRSERGVLLAASLDRGIDLAHEQCRVIVVAKVPFPSLGDKQVSARLHQRGGQVWYSVRTIRSLVQMTGRGMRSEDDYCSSYILDSQFMSNVYSKNKHLLPSWWRDALVWNKANLGG